MRLDFDKFFTEIKVLIYNYDSNSNIMSYSNFTNDRKSLGYKCLADMECGYKLVVISDSTVLLCKKCFSKSKKGILVVVLGVSLTLSNPQAANSMEVTFLRKQELVNLVQQKSLNRLIQESNLPMNVEERSKIVLIRRKSDLMNPEWVKKFIFSIRGGEEVDESLIISILSKVEESDLDVSSINKILLKLGDSILSIASNEKLLKILAELEKPVRSSEEKSGSSFLPGADRFKFRNLFRRRIASDLVHSLLIQ